jgi:hypothetical protein
VVLVLLVVLALQTQARGSLWSAAVVQLPRSSLLATLCACYHNTQSASWRYHARRVGFQRIALRTAACCAHQLHANAAPMNGVPKWQRTRRAHTARTMKM